MKTIYHNEALRLSPKSPPSKLTQSLMDKLPHGQPTSHPNFIGSRGGRLSIHNSDSSSF